MKSEEKFVRGMGQFVDDIKFPDMLYMSVVRSDYARARLLKVKGGINARVFNHSLAAVGEGAMSGFEKAQHMVFASGFVNYLGEPIAAVYSDDPYKSEDLIDSVEVDYEPLKPVIDPEKALTSEPIHSGFKSNIISEKWMGKDFKTDSPIVLEDSFRNNRIVTNPIEPRGVIANYDGKRLTLWIGTQSVFSIREGICGAMGLSPENVHIIQADTGGAFGSKGGLYPEYVMASYIAMKEKRPVKWIETRREHLMASHPGRGALAKMKLFADRTGKITGLKGEILVDSGAYAGGTGEFSSRFITHQITGQYKIENAYFRALSVFTNKVPQGPYRGAGRPEAAFFTERMVDMLADELKMDPFDVRLINATDKPFVSPMGMKIGASKPFMIRARKELGYVPFDATKDTGIALFVLVPASQPGESARIKSEGGRIRVWLGGNVHGQGHEGFVRRIVNEELGVREDLVDLEMGDSDALEDGVGAWGSRSAMMGGSAVTVAARKLKEQVRKKLGSYSAAKLLEGSFDIYEFFNYKDSYNSFGSNLAKVSVDSYDRIKVLEDRSYYDLGRVLNRQMVRGQIVGGNLQGIGQTLSENIEYDDDGQLLTGSISEAGLLNSEITTKYTVKLDETPSDLPSGAKGLGEAPTIGTPSAIARAVEVYTGKRIRETPIKLSLH
ncbi:MAG: xanthine dehydrogenase family protein molybdopterin-binding subunit [Candidatus Thermoplasmatota archaeon]|nr:xanthine dehydrogenase family protein molybdopterin-binding subunit [Candidatus Thermoplasmatota archaeon]